MWLLLCQLMKSFPSWDWGSIAKGDAVKIFTVLREEGNCFFRVLTESKALKPFSMKCNEEVVDVWRATAFYIMWVVPHRCVSPGILFQPWNIHHFLSDCLMLCVKIVLMTNGMQMQFLKRMYGMCSGGKTGKSFIVWWLVTFIHSCGSIKYQHLTFGDYRGNESGVTCDGRLF